MKPRFLSTLLSAAMVAVTFNASAIIAKKGVLNVEQADGTELRVKLVGDERHHYYTTEDDYLLVEQGNIFFYGQLDPATGKVINSQRRAFNINQRPVADKTFLSAMDKSATIKAYRDEMRSSAPARMQRAATANNAGYPAGPGLFPGTSFPSIGEQKGLVILVQYTDVHFTSVSNPKDYWTRMLNDEGFSDNGGTGSARDWFISNSQGIFKPQFDVYGPVQLAHNQAYYGGNDWWGNDQHPEEMAIEACQLLDGEVDFSEYDRDGDGYIDNVYIFYAGRGEADGGSSNTVWPHSWEVSSATSTPYYFDGKRLDRYACSNERDAYNPDGIGTFCHEFSHVMGLPDEYSTNYSSAFTPGAYSPMDYGPYNNDGRTPPAYSAFNRYALGWVDPIVIDGRMNGELDHIMDSGKCYIVKTGKENEYFMFENRQLNGWDAYIPGHGMLVWHIDYDSSVWANNSPNNTSSHQYIDIEEADGTQSEYTRDGDPFPGTSNKTEFTDDSNPSMKTWAKVGMGLPITDIAENNGIITFKVLGGIINIDPVTIDTESAEVTATTISVSWSPSAEARNYRVTLRRESTTTRPVVVPEFDNLNVGNVTSYTFENLLPETHYYVTVVGENGGCFSPEATADFTTLKPKFEDSQVKLDEPSDITGSSFVMNWFEREDAVEYFVNVFEKVYDNIETDGCDFTNGLNNLPEGWSTTTNATYGTEAYSGQAVPSLKLVNNGQYIMTPKYDGQIISMSFWHRGASTKAASTLSVKALVEDEWFDVADFNLVTGIGGRTYTVENFPFGASAVKIIFNKVGTGYLAIDDIVVNYGGAPSIVATEPYVDYSAGGTTSVRIEHLKPLTTYFYTVHASDGEKLNRKSDEGKVTTSQGEVGIDCVDAVSTAISAHGSVVSVAAAPGTAITVTDPAGRLIMSRTAGAGVSRFELPAKGLYIVRAGMKAAKVIVR